ncbi:MAG: hypothetical protein LBI38_00340 [Oscillospiraceae bacterium]|jgi:hypothetical protein|nr:hypothetical protein [Oscillospiraceae bacterium]
MAEIKRLESELKKLRRELDEYRDVSKKRLNLLESGNIAVAGDIKTGNGFQEPGFGEEEAKTEIRRRMSDIKQKYSALESELKRLYEDESRENALAVARVREDARALAEERERERVRAENALNDILDYCDAISGKYPFEEFAPGAAARYKSGAEELKGFYKNGLYQSVIGAAAGLRLRIDLDAEEISRLSERHKSYSDVLLENARELETVIAEIKTVEGLSGAFYEDEGRAFAGADLDYWTGGVYSGVLGETREILDSVKSSKPESTAGVYQKSEILRKNAAELSKARDDFISAVKAYDERMYIIAPDVERVMNSLGYECEDWYFFRDGENGEKSAGKKDAFRMVFGAFAVDIFPIFNKAASRYENHIGIEVDEGIYGANAGSVAESVKKAVKGVFKGKVIADYAEETSAAEKTRAVLVRAVNGGGAV